MWRFGLRARTAASYVLVTAAAVLIVEAVLVGFVISSAGDSTLLAKLQNLAGEDAKIMSASATKIVMSGAESTARGLLKAAMTASFGLTGLDRSHKEVPVPPKTAAGEGKVAVEAPRKAGQDLVETLLDPAGRVIDSTAPKSFPPGLLVLTDPPPQAEGQGGWGKTPAGTAAWWTSPILAPKTAGTAPAGGPLAPAKASKGEKLQIIGYIYVQAPADAYARVPFMDAATPLLAPGALILALVVPVGRRPAGRAVLPAEDHGGGPGGGGGARRGPGRQRPGAGRRRPARPAGAARRAPRPVGRADPARARGAHRAGQGPLQRGDRPLAVPGARSLSLGKETVKTHVSSILAKLGVADRTQAAIVGLQHGLVPLDEALDGDARE
ncbi:hypothetical protein Ssi03_51220 [Sphaerisporangium siamense]|uniref:HTH luxR-type domain-containing protein n=1 Tax=Sphaerisporangium siamense TaxID=795645 RepID=A0A7W7GAW1_9ACTN|nr:LuxR C-terminal-related transcriptional regulator [Sphaerisporangium siamense]MBB4702175.1 hypothetical protein [Sphaerisporangium siamense]GII87132.1 hypothetical protein Ssi03_51220 [Sphaerisporangium siamense]